MKTHTLKATNASDATVEAFALLSRTHRVLEASEATRARYDKATKHVTDHAVKAYVCTTCGAEFYLQRSILGSSAAHARGEYKFQVKAGAHALHLTAECAS